MLPKAFYTTPDNIPNCRYIKTDYPRIVDLIVDGVKSFMQTEVMTDPRVYESWAVGAATFVM
jgi:hypothetical protein